MNFLNLIIVQNVNLIYYIVYTGVTLTSLESVNTAIPSRTRSKNIENVMLWKCVKVSAKHNLRVVLGQSVVTSTLCNLPFEALAKQKKMSLTTVVVSTDQCTAWAGRVQGVRKPL